MAEYELDELADYESDEEQEQTPAKSAEKKAEAKGDRDIYSSVHTTSFEDLMLRPELLKAISACGFEHPSEVQNECIPQAILGTDVLCQAKSGMGKTAVFVLAVLQQVFPDHVNDEGVQALILCHNRELAFQISSEFERLKKGLEGVKVKYFFGGSPINEDIDALKEKPQIVVGTPGRIKHLVKDNHLDLSKIKYFVLDECDKMLEGVRMRADVQEIFRRTPHNKQVMMFSATMDGGMRDLCKRFMHNPLEILVTDGSKLTLHGLTQYHLSLPENQKNHKLFDILDAIKFNQLVIFVKSRLRAETLGSLLVEGKFPAIVIHGDLDQPVRLERFNKFKDFKTRLLVTTDLFGRGIDVSKVNVVINYDMPVDADAYLHRVGRAGRFGTKGLAISFVSTPEDAQVLNDVQARFHTPVPVMPDEIDCSVYTSGP